MENHTRIGATMKYPIPILLLFILSITIVASLIPTSAQCAATGWSQLKGQVVSSVAWSPDGRNIAFIATPKESANNDEIFVVTKASIWLVSVSDSIGVPRLLRTVKVNKGKGYGTPVGLFWLTGNKLGWATSDCKLFFTDLQNGKTKTLSDSNVVLGQSRSFWDSYGFDDIYYDPRSQELLLSGLARPGSKIYIYNIRNSKLRSVVFPKYDAFMTMGSWTNPQKVNGQYRQDFYIAGHYTESPQDYYERNRHKPNLYTPGYEYPTADGMYLWHASGNPKNYTKRLAKGKNPDIEQKIFFPRPSPDGDKLLWIESRLRKPDTISYIWNIVLYQTRSKTRRVIAHIPDARYWYDIIPGLGCPFSWSPRGDRIAYAYGSTIRILPVGKPAKLKKNPDKLGFLDVYSDLSGKHGRMYVWSSNGQQHEISLPYQPYQFCFNPDGSKIVFVGASKPRNWGSSELMILNMKTQKVRQVTKGFLGAVDASIAWRPGGMSVAVSRMAYKDTVEEERGDGGLWLVDLRNGKTRQLIHGSDADVSLNLRPQFSSDGSMLACLRRGEYPAVFEVAYPGMWYSFGSSGLNPACLMCLTWMNGNKKLVFAVTSAKRTVFSRGKYSEVKGPGGIWEWNLVKSGKLIPAVKDQEEQEVKASSGGIDKAKLLAAGGESIYAVSASPDSSKLVFCSDSGISLWDMKKHKRIRLINAKQMPELKLIPDTEYNEPMPWADIAWSHSGKYICIRTSSSPDKLRIIDVTTKRIVYTYLSKNGQITAHWQP